jgi:hypothetical protein
LSALEFKKNLLEQGELMQKLNRREFIGAVIGGGAAVAATGSLLWGRPAEKSWTADTGFIIDPAIKSPTDKVPLGNSGITVSLVGIGTGSGGWARQSNQTRLGQPEFTRQIRHAFDNGINFFDLADQYGSHPFFNKAMTGVARDKYVIQTKSTSRRAKEARADIDRFLQELNTDYLDSLIIHNVTEDDWTTRFEEVMEVFAEAKKAGKIRAHGVTCHSFESSALEQPRIAYGRRCRNGRQAFRKDAAQRSGHDRNESRRTGLARRGRKSPHA